LHSIVDCITVDAPVSSPQQTTPFSIKSKARQSLLPLQLTFFNFDTKLKFAVTIGAAMNPDGLVFSLLGLEAFYGQVDGEAIRSVVEENCGNLRRIVAGLNEFMTK
jgi:hypothetical protein